MKRKYLLFLLLSASTSFTYAQEQKPFPSSSISIGPEYAIPTGDFRESDVGYGLTRYHYGLGGSIRYEYRINKTYGLSLQAGAIRYKEENGNGSFTAIPVKLGGNFRYRSLFAEPQFGLTNFAGNQSIYQNASTTYGLAIGSYITRHIVLTGNYERWNKGGFAASHFGVRLAYAFFPGRLSLTDSASRARVTPSYDFHRGYDKDGAYWRKHKTFKTLGWVSIGVGVPLTLLGFVTAIASIESDSIHPSTYEWMLGSGAALTVSSVPFFIFSHKYKKMARRY